MGHVYIIQNADQAHLHKIGFSRSPMERLKTLQTGSADKLRLVAYIPGTREDEAELHAYFKFCRVSGEWFDFSDEIANSMLGDVIAAASLLGDIFQSWNRVGVKTRAAAKPEHFAGPMGSNYPLALAWQTASGQSCKQLAIHLAQMVANPYGWDPSGAEFAYGLRAATARAKSSIGYMYGCALNGIETGRVCA